MANEHSIKVQEVNLKKVPTSEPFEVAEENIFFIRLQNQIHDAKVPCRLLSMVTYKLVDSKDKDQIVLTAIESFESQVDFSFIKIEKSDSINEDTGSLYSWNLY